MEAIRHITNLQRSANKPCRTTDERPAGPGLLVDLAASRSGITLTEVLMSLMIMSIGISAVAVLFPISTLRSIQANQLTHAAILKYNVEALLQTDPTWITDPDRDGDLAEHFQSAVSRNYIVDPLGFYTHYADGNPALAAVFGNDGITSAGTLQRWGGGLKTNDGVQVLDPFAPMLTAPYPEALRLQALSVANQGDGWTTDIDTNAVSPIFAGPSVVGVQLPQDLDLRAVATSDLAQAAIPGPAGFEYLAPDPELYRIVVYSLLGKQMQAYPLTSLDTSSGSPNSGPWLNSAYWGEDINADGTADHDYNMNGAFDSRTLPVEFRELDLDGDGNLDYGIGRVLLQSRRLNDFSWLLSVRRRSDGFVRSVDVVARYSNGVDPQDERLFEATFVKGTNVVGIRYPYRITASDTTTPRFKRGKFVLDTQNARWYRVQDYKDRPLGNIGWSYPEYDAVVYTETEITDAAGEDQFSKYDSSGAVSLLLNGVLDPGQYDQLGIVVDPKVSNPTPPPLPASQFLPVPEDEVFPGDSDGVMDFGLAMFPSGIIDVYPMGSMKMPSSL